MNSFSQTQEHPRLKVEGGVRKSFILELCLAALQEQMRPSQVPLAILHCVQPPKMDTTTILVDILWFLSLNIEFSSEDNQAKYICLGDIVNHCVRADLLCIKKLHERCDGMLLKVAGFIETVDSIKRKEVRLNTRLVYTQQKANLLQDEAEGWARSFALLHTLGVHEHSYDCAALTKTVTSLIGTYNLDPCRFCELILDAYEHDLTNIVYSELLKIFSSQLVIVRALAFRFRCFQSSQQTEATPEHVYRLAAELLQNRIIRIEELYESLAGETQRTEGISKASYRDGTDDQHAWENSNKKGTSILRQVPFSASCSISASSQNQILGLIKALLSKGDWSNAKKIIDRLAELGVNPLEAESVARSLCTMIGRKISMSYASIVPWADKKDRSKRDEVIFPLSREEFELLLSAGPYLGNDVIVFTRSVRVITAHFAALEQQAAFQDNIQRARLEEVVGRVLLPALTLIPSNPALAMEMWALLQHMSYTSRFRSYFQWRQALTQKDCQQLASSRANAERETKSVMRRLSKDKDIIKEFGRKLGKAAHCAPLEVFHTVVSQIEAYNNMISPVVESFKFLSNFGLDVLTFVLIEALAKSRTRLKQDGTNISMWLSSLATFCGLVSKKYNGFELTALMQYICNQLKDRQSIDLLVLKEVLSSMAGIEVLSNLTEQQIESRCGTEVLQRMSASCSVGNVQLTLKMKHKGLDRLRAALTAKDQCLIPLLVLIAQARSWIIFHSEFSQLKIISDLFDKCTETLMQYVEFIVQSHTVVQMADILPPLSDLVNKYHVGVDIAFLVYRPIFQNIIHPKPGCSELEYMQQIALDVGNKVYTWDELNGIVKACFPPHVWHHVTPAFVLNFWSLSAYDIYIPRTQYEVELSKLHSERSRIQKSAMREPSQSSGGKLKRELERNSQTISELQAEVEKHERVVAEVDRRLKRESDTWFMSTAEEGKSDLINIILEACILQRAMLSHIDSIYCHRFLLKLNSMATKNFSTVEYFIKLLSSRSTGASTPGVVTPIPVLVHIIFSCTENEANHVGKFLCQTFQTLDQWTDKAIYENECKCMPGFSSCFGNAQSRPISHEEFVRITYRWLLKATRAFLNCLESDEYMHIRNSLIVLNRVSHVFPKLRKCGQHIEKRVAEIKLGDSRADLKTMAEAYLASLSKQKGTWKGDDELIGGSVSKTKLVSVQRRTQEQREASGTNSTVHERSPNLHKSGHKSGRIDERTQRQDVTVAGKQRTSNSNHNQTVQNFAEDKRMPSNALNSTLNTASTTNRSIHDTNISESRRKQDTRQLLSDKKERSLDNDNKEHKIMREPREVKGKNDYLRGGRGTEQSGEQSKEVLANTSKRKKQY